VPAPARSHQANTPDRLHQHIGQAGEQQSELVGPPVMGAGAIGKQPQLLLLDAVIHLASGAVESFVELLSIALEVGEDEAGVAPLELTVKDWLRIQSK